MHRELAALLGRVAELERRLDNVVRHGPVAAVDPQKQVARIRIGGSDEEPMLGPWVSYASHAGDFKSVVHPTVGQNMTAFSPTGDPRQALLLPFTFSNQFESPSTDQNKHYLAQFKGAEIYVENDQLVVKKGESSLTLKDDKATVKSKMFVVDSPDIRWGGEDADRPVSAQGTVDDCGCHDIGNFLTTVKGK